MIKREIVITVTEERKKRECSRNRKSDGNREITEDKN